MLKTAALSVLILLEVISVYPQNIFSQYKYDYNFDVKWEWEDLINKAALFNPELIKSIGQLKNEITIEDARMILKDLSELSTLQELSSLNKTVQSDSREDRLKWDSLIAGTFSSIPETEDFGGLISVLMKLTKLRTENSKDLFRFHDNKYLSQPVKENKKKVKIDFDYSAADKILEYYNKGEQVIGEITEVPAYEIVINEKSLDGVSKTGLEYFLKESLKNDYLSNIYKWLNPGSYWNLGGVSIYKSNLEKTLSSIKHNERNIRTDVENHISEYLPDGVFFSSGIMFLYGKKNPGWISGNKNLGIDLEYFGDNYKYLTRYIQHRLFKIAQKEIQLPVDGYAVKSHDRDFVKVLENVLENGTANYVGPIGTETRPWYLLEKDFALFNNTFRNMYYGNNRQMSDSLVNAGYSGDAPFYTMGTQMAFIIEATVGRNALIEAIRLGPVYFFNRYIEAYKEYPDKIRRVFTFSEKLEKKIASLGELFPDYVIKDALAMKKYRSDTTAIKAHVSKFLRKYSDLENRYLLYLLAGQLLLEAGDFENARAMFFKGISSRKNKGKLAGEIAESFFTCNAFKEALDFYNYYVENSPGDAQAFEERGQFYYRTGDNEKARNDFEKAVVIDSRLSNARAFLQKINSN